ncbi:MAG: prolipoprotein diacylglyceryl transferase, partial [Burkholderiaceae bacterium]|nr:prolipoprotein diacylglyceryl transferase [Burkholderiaceae bacterium]
RIGNFINGELWGRPADPLVWPWAMIFPQAGDNVPRHPSQLYQFALEGVLLFVILWLYSRRERPAGAVGSMFLLGYGTLRFIAEFGREPDSFLGLLALKLSMGQWLSIPMIVIGAVLLWFFSRRARG